MKTEKFYDKKEKRDKYRARFELNGKSFRPVADTKKELNKIVDEIRAREHRAKRNLEPVEKAGPTLEEVFNKIEPLIPKREQRLLATRVFKNFLALLPEGLKVKDLKRSHYQIYIDWRSTQKSRHTKELINIDTVYKELWCISGAIGQGELYWYELESWTKPKLPAQPKKKTKREKRRTKIVNVDEELYVLLTELRKTSVPGQPASTLIHRRKIADDLEFRYETGLRRKEVARLEIRQYNRTEKALRNVKRWKTDTTTKFFPLSTRAVQIIESRLKGLPKSAKYIFTESGEPIKSFYKTLKLICGRLGIAYGRYTEDGLIPHDLRHKFASEIIMHGDIETAREYLGHANIGQTADYLHTDENKMLAAMKKKKALN